jgi:hypothetical protein
MMETVRPDVREQMPMRFPCCQAPLAAGVVSELYGTHAGHGPKVLPERGRTHVGALEVANKLDPLTEQYAGLFKTGLRTPVMRKPSDYGMAFEETWFPSMDGVPLEA